MNGSKIYRTRNGVEFDCIFDTRDASKDYLRQMIAWRGGLFASFGKRCVPLQLLHIDETGYIRYMTTPMPPPRGDIYTMCLFQDRIYMGVSAYHRANETGGCEVWTYDGTRFERCSRPGFGNPNNEYIHSMVVFKDTLVCGVYNYKEGCELWATKDGHEWCCLSNNGFRLGTANETIAYSLCSYTDRLYVGTSNTAQGFGMYAIDKGALDAIFDHRFNR